MTIQPEGRFRLNTPDGHIVVALLIFLVGVLLYAAHYDYGKEVMSGALGSLWTLLQLRGGNPTVGSAGTAYVMDNKEN